MFGLSRIRRRVKGLRLYLFLLFQSYLLLFIDFQRYVMRQSLTFESLFNQFIKYCEHLAKVFNVRLSSFYPIPLRSAFFFIGKLLKVGDVLIANLQIVLEFYFILSNDCSARLFFNMRPNPNLIYQKSSSKYHCSSDHPISMPPSTPVLLFQYSI